MSGPAQIAKSEAQACSHFHGSDQPTWELYSTCIHCGLCLNQCPTYRVLGMEMDSPRGRIYQVLQVDAGRLAIGDSFVTHIDRCLACRACETACPSGVHYGRIVERARAQIEQHYRRPLLERLVRRKFYSVIRSFSQLARYARLLRWYQRSGAQRVVRASGILKLLRLDTLEKLAPRIEDRFSTETLGMVFPAEGERVGTVALLTGCIASFAFAELNQATIRVLNRNGVEVHVPRDQGCCGALHAHGGLRDGARELARNNIEVMLQPQFDAIVTNAAGCGSTLKEYDDLLGEDASYRLRAREFATKVKDVSEYLAEIGVRPPLRPLAARITYQDPCHLAHGQRIRSAPRQLLLSTGATLVEMPRSDQCCGSAGTYNVTEHALSMEILERKMDDVQSAEAEMIATANVGCMLQLRAGCEMRGLRRQVLHVVEVLDAAYRAES